MIRKIIHITIVMLLFATTTGMTFYSHYCGSTFKSASINTEPNFCCGDDCNSCHNESVIVKIHDDFSATTFNFDFHTIVFALPVVQQLIFEELTIAPQFMLLANDLPPPPVHTILSLLQTYLL